MLKNRQKILSLMKLPKSKGATTAAKEEGGEVMVPAKEPWTMQERVEAQGTPIRERVFDEGVVRYSLIDELRENLPVHQEHAKARKSYVVITILGIIAFVLVRYDIKKHRRLEMAGRERQRQRRKLEEMDLRRRETALAIN